MDQQNPSNTRKRLSNREEYRQRAIQKRLAELEEEERRMAAGEEATPPLKTKSGSETDTHIQRKDAVLDDSDRDIVRFENVVYLDENVEYKKKPGKFKLTNLFRRNKKFNGDAQPRRGSIGSVVSKKSPVTRERTEDEEIIFQLSLARRKPNSSTRSLSHLKRPEMLEEVDGRAISTLRQDKYRLVLWAYFSRHIYGRGGPDFTEEEKRADLDERVDNWVLKTRAVADRQVFEQYGESLSHFYTEMAKGNSFVADSFNSAASTLSV